MKGDQLFENDGSPGLSKGHRRNTSSSSFEEGMKRTREIFDTLSPFSSVQQETLDGLEKSYNENNQKFLQLAEKESASNVPKPAPIVPSDTKSKLPPRAEHSRSRTDSSLLETSACSADIPSAEPTPGLPLSGRNVSSTEKQLMGRLVRKAQHNAGPSHRYLSSVSDSSAGFTFENSEDDFSSLTSADTRPRAMHDGMKGSNGRQTIIEDAESRQRKIEMKRQGKDAKFIRKYYDNLQNEREGLVAQWREEFTAEQNQSKPVKDYFEDCDKFRKDVATSCMDSIWRFLSYAEVFIANMPLTIGAVGLSWVTQGVIWFKFMEENIGSCSTVRFNSVQCTYPEFPGCFECDTTNPIYRFVVTFHYFCHCVAGACCLLFLAKCVIAWRTVADELSNPTTSTPCGVVCITIICVAAGRGLVGEAIVLITAVFHVLLSFWFLYIAIYKYRLWPDPGWFPNTVGVAYAAIKTWLYFPIPGIVFMTLCMMYLFSTFFISIYRVYHNQKISAPVCFISLSAPSITMYAMTIMAQPSRQREILLKASPELETHFDTLHRNIYLPVQHFMMILSLIGFASSLHCLYTRWPKFKLKEFSPAHVAFIFPILSHTNAVQAYRSGVDSFSSLPIGSPFNIALFSYWFTCLVVGTILNLVFTCKYVRRLPKWTKMDTVYFMEEYDDKNQDDEATAASGCETIVHQDLLHENDPGASTGERLIQTFVSPAVLAANETGTLIRVRRGTQDYETHGPYIRTRHVTSLGFDLTMTQEELRHERAEMLDRVAKKAPRTRNKTLSIPTMMKLKGKDGSDIYGTFVVAAPGDREEGNDVEATSRTGTTETRPSTYQHQRSSTWGAWMASLVNPEEIPEQDMSRFC